jgi:hypothetical protein
MKADYGYKTIQDILEKRCEMDFELLSHCLQSEERCAEYALLRQRRKPFLNK